MKGGGARVTGIGVGHAVLHGHLVGDHAALEAAGEAADGEHHCRGSGDHELCVTERAGHLYSAAAFVSASAERS